MRGVECRPIPVEFVVRGYLTGVSDTSIGGAYERGEREFCGHALPDGLRRHQAPADPAADPDDQGAQGRARPQRQQGLADRARPHLRRALRRASSGRSLALFAAGQAMADERGLILVDTKYEFGERPDGEVVLIDEIHTPDSSRYWYADSYADAMARGADPRQPRQGVPAPLAGRARLSRRGPPADPARRAARRGRPPLHRGLRARSPAAPSSPTSEPPLPAAPQLSASPEPSRALVRAPLNSRRCLRVTLPAMHAVDDRLVSGLCTFGLMFISACCRA
jgi:hypothetical protein